jgi:hypothetical protein
VDEVDIRQNYREGYSSETGIRISYCIMGIERRLALEDSSPFEKKKVVITSLTAGKGRVWGHQQLSEVLLPREKLDWYNGSFRT